MEVVNVIMELLRATPIEDIFVDGCLEEDFEKGEWYKYFTDKCVVYVEGHTHYHKIIFKKEEFDEKFVIKDFFNLSYNDLRKKYKKSKEECICLLRNVMQINDNVYINIINGIGYYRVEINDEDSQDLTLLRIDKDSLSIISAEYSGKYHFTKNRIDIDIINIIKNFSEQFKLFAENWNTWYTIHQKYYDGKYVYSSEGDEY